MHALTCNDCKNGENICNFGACGKKGHEPLYSDLVPHPIDVVKNMDGEERYKCFPLLPKNMNQNQYLRQAKLFYPIMNKPISHLLLRNLFHRHIYRIHYVYTLI